MKELKICRHYENKFTVAVSFGDFDAFPYDGTFPDVHRYYIFDTESEMIEEFKKADLVFTEEVDAIYYGREEVTYKYLVQAEAYRKSYKLLDCWSA